MNGIHVMTKPTGSVCNLDCEYCFYLEKELLYPDNNHYKMSDETLELYIKQNIEAQPKSVTFYTFAWQGGEPTLMGLDFFKKAVTLQKKYANGVRCENTFQTNGLLLNDEWCSFFSKEQFLIGISLDGTSEHHDLYRKTRSGKGTHTKVISAIALLKKHNVKHNALAVIHQGNVNDPLGVYQFIRDLEINYIQFTPLVERRALESTEDGLTLVHNIYVGEVQVTDWSITSGEYALFMNTVFDEWIKDDIGTVFIPTFENTLAMASGYESLSCIHAKTCGSAIVLERNGDIFSCDHFVYPEFKIGNIQKISLVDAASLTKQKKFGDDKQNNLSTECHSCRYVSLCNGGCPKHRFSISSNGKPNKNYLCDGYKNYFNHVLPRLRVIYNGLTQGWSKEKLHNEVSKACK